MNKEIFTRIRDWVEPAHPAIIERYEDLVDIYTQIRDGYQTQIDEAFDSIARQIGFVVATTIPAILEVGEKGQVKAFRMSGEHLQGTLFDRQFTRILSKMEPIARKGEGKFIRAGTYPVYMVWVDALKLRLRRDWMEPAHFKGGSWIEQLQSMASHRQFQQSLAPVVRDIPEPAHWFDPTTVLDVEDLLTISVLDEVYPDLRLGDRVAFFRQDFLRKISPEVMEPAHFRPQEGLEPRIQKRKSE